MPGPACFPRSPRGALWSNFQITRQRGFAVSNRHHVQRRCCSTRTAHDVSLSTSLLMGLNLRILVRLDVCWQLLLLLFAPSLYLRRPGSFDLGGRVALAHELPQQSRVIRLKSSCGWSRRDTQAMTCSGHSIHGSWSWWSSRARRRKFAGASYASPGTIGPAVV